MKTLKLSKVQKEQLFLTIGRNAPYFPFHCVDVAYVLSKYMKDNGIDYEIRHYQKKHHGSPSLKTTFHYVVYSNGFIYDFAICQFYIKHKLMKNIIKHISDEEFIDTYLYEYQGGKVMFEESEYEKRFKRIEKDEDIEKNVYQWFKNNDWKAKSVNQLIQLVGSGNILPK